MIAGFARSYDVQNVANGAGQNKWSLRKGVTSAEKVDGNGHAVGQVQQHHGGRNDGIESAKRSVLSGRFDGCAYLVEPRKIKPKIMTRPRLRYRAFKGTFNLG